MNEPLSQVCGPHQHQQQRKMTETNNNCTVFGRGEKSERLLSFSTSAIIRKGGAEKQRNMSWCSFGVELEPQSLILKRAWGLCDVVCACVCSWVGGVGECVCVCVNFIVCLHTFTHTYDPSYDKEIAIIHFNGPFALKLKIEALYPIIYL